MKRTTFGFQLAMYPMLGNRGDPARCTRIRRRVRYEGPRPEARASRGAAHATEGQTQAHATEAGGSRERAPEPPTRKCVASFMIAKATCMQFRARPGPHFRTSWPRTPTDRQPG